MNELKEIKKEKLSFQEVFYENEINDEKSVNEAVYEKSEEYKAIQQRIKSLRNETDSSIAPNLKKSKKCAAKSITSFVLFTTLGLIASIFGPAFSGEVDFIFNVYMITTTLLGWGAIWFALRAINLRERMSKEKNRLIKIYRNQLLRHNLADKAILSQVDVNENWQKIDVLENGRTETYMIRIKTDDRGLDHIESMKVVEDN